MFPLTPFVPLSISPPLAASFEMDPRRPEDDWMIEICLPNGCRLTILASLGCFEF
jgi:transposase